MKMRGEPHQIYVTRGRTYAADARGMLDVSDEGPDTADMMAAGVFPTRRA